LPCSKLLASKFSAFLAVLLLLSSHALSLAQSMPPIPGQDPGLRRTPLQESEMKAVPQPYRLNPSEGISIEEILIVDALVRKSVIHLPAGWTENKNMPLILVLHGAKLSAKIAEIVTGFDRLSNKKGFIVAYPDAIYHQWSDGRRAEDNPSYGIDDVKFLSQLMDYMVWKYHVNPQRIYVAGYSSGGMMAQKLGMEITDKIAAIAEVAATIPLPQLALQEKPSRPLPILMINGTQDPAFPWNGGNTQIIGIRVGAVASVMDSVNYWLTANGGLMASPDANESVDKKDGTKVEVTNYPTANNTSVMLYKIIGGGHTWPGSDVPLRYIPLLGRQSKNLRASELIWEFFNHY
jgi:polyhydroxybutyrate depolymerase